MAELAPYQGNQPTSPRLRGAPTSQPTLRKSEMAKAHLNKNSTFQRLIPLLLILLLAWFVRIYALDADSLWADEILSYQRGSEANREMSYAWLRDGNHPPLYELLILHEWLKVGRSDFFLRFPSVFFGVLTISVVYILAQAAFDRRTGQLSALLLALSPLHVYYSREARMYGVLACLITLALYFLYQAIQSGHFAPRHASMAQKPRYIKRLHYWAAFSFFMACSLYTHYYTFFTLLAIQGVMLVRLWVNFDSQLLEEWIGSNLGIMILLLPWLPTLFFQLDNQPVDWILATSFIQLLELPVYFFVRREIVPELVWWLVTFGMWALLIVTLLSLVRSRKSRLEPFMSYLYLAICFVGTLLIAYLISFFKPLVVTRYFMGIVPIACILVAFALRKGRAIALPIGLLLLATALFSSYKIATSRWQEDWRGVTTYIEQHAQAGDRMLLFFPVAFEFWVIPFEHYYDGDLPRTYVLSELSNEIELKSALERLEPHQRVWVIQSARNTVSGPLPDRFNAHFADHRLMATLKFDEALLLKEYTVDLLLLEFVAE